jgi:hypothetical protein
MRGLIGEKDCAGVFGLRCDEEDATAALTNPEMLRVDGPIRPVPAAIVEPARDVSNWRARMQIQQIGHVLENHPSWPGLFDESERFVDETSLDPGDACRSACLTQICTWESSGDHVDVWERSELTDVPHHVSAVKASPQSRRSWLPVLAENCG